MLQQHKEGVFVEPHSLTTPLIDSHPWSFWLDNHHCRWSHWSRCKGHQQATQMQGPGLPGQEYWQRCMSSGVGQGGATAPPLMKVGGQCPPTFWTCLHLKWKKRFSISATNVEQLNQNFCLMQISPEAVEHENTKKKFWGVCPQTPLNRNKKSCPPHFSWPSYTSVCEWFHCDITLCAVLTNTSLLLAAN